jgi:hypothetical protein
MLSSDEIAALLVSDPPEGILTGHEGNFDQPLSAFAEQNHYTPIDLSDGSTLWLRP